MGAEAEALRGAATVVESHVRGHCSCGVVTLASPVPPHLHTCHTLQFWFVLIFQGRKHFVIYICLPHSCLFAGERQQLVEMLVREFPDVFAFPRPTTTRPMGMAQHYQLTAEELAEHKSKKRAEAEAAAAALPVPPGRPGTAPTPAQASADGGVGEAPMLPVVLDTAAEVEEEKDTGGAWAPIIMHVQASASLPLSLSMSQINVGLMWRFHHGVLMYGVWMLLRHAFPFMSCATLSIHCSTSPQLGPACHTMFSQPHT